MVVKDIVSMVKNSVLVNLAIATKDDVILQFIHMGLSDLYRKFGLLIKSDTIRTTPNKYLYEIDNEDLSILVNVYDAEGNLFQDSDVLDKVAEFKRVSYNSFILSHPKDGYVNIIYYASPPIITSIEDTIKLPHCMSSALVYFVGYTAHSTIINTQASDTLNPSNTFLQAYELACRELEKMGYKIGLNTESLSVQAKGFS